MIKNNFRLTIFFGDVFELTAKLAYDFDNTAFLVDVDNCSSFLSTELKNNVTIYTSLGDLYNNLPIAWDLLTSADEIVYCPPDVWSDKKSIDITNPTGSIHGLTEHLLLKLPKHIKIKNFNVDNLIPDIIPLVDKRKSNNTQLWFAGCSITHGVGVDTEQRYGELIAKELQLPCSFLTRPGSSIDWASDQIIRSDVRPGDIVVWGLTAIERLTYVHNNQLLNGINYQSYKINKNLEKIVPLSALLSENTFYNHIYSIERAVNFCKVSKAKLLIVGLLISDSCLRYVADKSYFHCYSYPISFDNQNIIAFNFSDYGSDKRHPGPEQHKLYKDFILPLI